METMKTQFAGANGERAASLEAETCPVNREDALAFRLAMGERPPGEGGENADGKENGEGGFAPAYFAGQQVFEPRAQPVEAKLLPVADMAELAEKIAGRVLAGSNAAGDAEVRLYLSEKTLPDTEIWLTMRGDGPLEVRLASGNTASLEVLHSGREALAQALARHGLDAQIIVQNADAGQGSGQSFSEGRSRGQEGYDEEEG